MVKRSSAEMIQIIKRFDACTTERDKQKLCKDVGVGERTIYNWKKKRQNGFSLERRGGSGRPRKLSNRQVKNLISSLESDPTISNETAVRRHKLPIHPRSVSVYLARMDYSRKKIVDEEPNVDIAASMEYLDQVKRIPFDRRVYMDESFLYLNEAPKYGRSPRGQRIYRLRKRHCRRETMFVAIRATGLCHPPYLTSETAKDAVVVDYVRKHLAPCLRSGDVVIWDRLGRSGRSKAPSAQHYNPEARDLILQRGANFLFLPPLGKLFNPAELAISFVKESVRHSPSALKAQKTGTELTHNQLLRCVRNGAHAITADHCLSWFRERANGRAFHELYPEQ